MTPSKQIKPAREWKGYTLEQIAYERVVTWARIEIEKEAATTNYDRLRQGNVGMSSSLFSRLTGALYYADYIVILVKLYRYISPLLRKRKK